MKQQKERKHKVKKADTLETSRKEIQKVAMSALRNGGFLFTRNESGIMTPAIVNTSITEMVGSVVAFAVSRAHNLNDLGELRKFLNGVVARMCGLREKDIAEASEPGPSPEELAAVINEAEGNVIKMPTNPES